MDVAGAVRRLWPGRHAHVSALDGGITNRNYRVELDGSVYVLRMGGVRTEILGIDRVAEHAASLRAQELGIGPAVEGFLESEGLLVTRFIDGRSIALEEMRSASTLPRVADALRRLHSAAAIPGRFDAHAVVDGYRAAALAGGVQIPEDFAAARKVSERIREARGNQPLVPCHNDLLNANFLDDGAIRIVDWEYAGMGDRFFDLANFSANHEFHLEDDRRLLAAYFGIERDADLAALRLMRFMSDFREAMWGVLQTAISELDFDFNGYAATHFARLENTARDPEFTRHLRAVRPV